MKDNHETCLKWYESSYSDGGGVKAQRLYPNEELCRFLGRNYFSKVPREKRSDIRILEIGCGSCSNLWMIASEGFETHGVDFSETSLELGDLMLRHWGVSAKLCKSDMCDLQYPDECFDCVIDVFSSYCLCEVDFHACLNEVQRVLRPGGVFFSYTPSTASHAFLNYAPSTKIDDWTLDGIRRSTSPYFGNHYPFRFITPEHYAGLLEERGFKIESLETVGRTYNYRSEYFEFVTISGRLHG